MSFEMVVIAGSGSDRLLGEAASAGLPVIIEPWLRAPIDLRSDARALRRLSTLLGQGNFDVVHTHCAKAGASAGWQRIAAACRGSCTPIMASRFTNSSRLPAATRMWPSSAVLGG